MGVASAVIKMDQGGAIIARYDSVKLAAEAEGKSKNYIGYRCSHDTCDAEGYIYRYETQAGVQSAEARREDVKAITTRRAASSRIVEEEQRLALVKKIQRDSATKLLSQGMDVLEVSHITGLGPETVGWILHRLKKQPASAAGTGI